MTKILVAEDSRTQALQVELLLKNDGFEVLTVLNGVQAMDQLESFAPDIVLTDLEMPEMDGLELVHKINELDAGMPVVLMTSRGSEEIALKALKSGAASYLPKRILETDLVEIMREVESVSKKQQDSRVILEHLTSTEYKFELGNRSELIQRLVSHLGDKLEEHKFNEIDVMQVTMALTEALTNAINHGNLELDSCMREEDEGGERYHSLAEERRGLAPYKDRSVIIRARLTADDVTFVITDQGPGFDISAIPDPTDPENLEKASGRGLMLIFTFMDEVHHNEVGNEITLVKQRSTGFSFDDDDDGEDDE